MGISLKKTLNMTGMTETYNSEFKDLIVRDCIKAVFTEEIAEWEANGGKVSYISHHPLLTPDKVTTRGCLVINLSLKNSGSGPSPNDNWLKGPNALKPMYGVFLCFCLYEVAIHFDLSKMFHTVRTGEPEKNMHLIIWRDGKNEENW